MSKQLKKHCYAERLKYMYMLEEGYSIEYIHRHYGINDALLGIYGHVINLRVLRDYIGNNMLNQIPILEFK